MTDTCLFCCVFRVANRLGLTPREAAARSPKSRASLDLLLREFEYHESRREKEKQFDVGRLRAALGRPG